jgi:hypothetical protein
MHLYMKLSLKFHRAFISQGNLIDVRVKPIVTKSTVAFVKRIY